MSDHVLSDAERREAALDHQLAARKAIDQAEVEPDPVQMRRLHVRAAGHLRIAAALLDENGRLSE